MPEILRLEASPANAGTRIVYFCPVAPSDDPSVYLAGLWLTLRGYAVTFICRGTAAEHECAVAKIPVIPIPAGSGCIDRVLWHVRAAGVLLRCRLQDRRAIFYLQRSESSVAAFLALTLLPSRRLIYHTQDFLEPGRHPFWERFERRLARRAGLVVMNEPNRARFMASHYRLKRAPIVVRTALPAEWPMPAADPALRRKLLDAVPSAGAEACLIMHQGPLTSVRCSEAVLRALNRLPTNFALVCTGMDDGASRWQGLMRELRVEQRVVCLPRLPFDQLLATTAACDVGLLLYPNDGIGNYYQGPGRLTQYLRCGVPVVTSRFPGLELLVAKYGIGVACEETDPDDIARSIRTLHDRPATVKRAERPHLEAIGRDELAYDRDAGRLEQAISELTGGLSR